MPRSLKQKTAVTQESWHTQNNPRRGQFERLIGLSNSAFNKSIGNDVEVALNNRPLIYLEDDV